MLPPFSFASTAPQMPMNRAIQRLGGGVEATLKKSSIGALFPSESVSLPQSVAKAQKTTNFQIIEVAYQTLLYQDVLSSKKNELLI